MKNRIDKKKLEYYCTLPYAIVIRPLTEDEGGGYLAEIPELHGCWADGKTPAEALRELQIAKRGWLTSMLKHDERIPEPKTVGKEIVLALSLESV